MISAGAARGRPEEASRNLQISPFGETTRDPGPAGEAPPRPYEMSRMQRIPRCRDCPLIFGYRGGKEHLNLM